MAEASLSLGVLMQHFFNERLVVQQNVSQNTISSYRDAWKLFFTFIAPMKPLGKSLSLEDVCAKNILQFLTYIENERKCCIRSRNQRLAAFKAFARFSIYTDPSTMAQMQQILEIPRKRHETKVVGYLTKDEMEAILSVPNRKTPSGRKQYALLIFLYNTGARVSEATTIMPSDVTVRKGSSQVLIYGKGSKQRIVPIWDETANILLEQITANKAIGNDTFIFLNARNEPLTRSGIAHILAEAVLKAADKCPSLLSANVTPHVLRHTTAMHLLQSGVDINLIRMWLGHVRLDTTHQYIEADLDMKRKALEKGGIILATEHKWVPTDNIISFLESLT